MFLKQIELKNFRNYRKVKLNFEKGTILVIGDNGQGKTNLLESIYYLSSGKSHRATSQLELINWNSSYFLIRAKAGNNEERLVEVQLSEDSNLKIRVDKIYQKRKSDFTNIIPSVIFNPDDLSLIKRGPSNRRDFMDEILEKTERGYTGLRAQYLKILSQRNSLVKSMAKKPKIGGSTFEVWNEKLAKYGTGVINARLKLLESINRRFTELMGHFFKASRAGLQYIPSWNRKQQKPLEKRLEILPTFERNLEANISRDLNLKTTTIGPHRDDLFIELGGRDIRTFGSQGQQRIAALCLKLCELFLLKEKLGKDPLFLLDDVLSELDMKRKKLLISLLDNKFQTFITTTNLSYIKDLDIDISKSYRVEGGNLFETGSF
ncbi:MAG: DNA replication/repair protein RecF [Candidatus Humimicrobiaceae bacterium]